MLVQRSMRRVSIDRGGVPDAADALPPPRMRRRREEEPTCWHGYRASAIVASLALTCVAAGYAAGAFPPGHEAAAGRGPAGRGRVLAERPGYDPDDALDENGTRHERRGEPGTEAGPPRPRRRATAVSSPSEESPTHDAAAAGEPEAPLASGDPCEMYSDESDRAVPCIYIGANDDGTVRVQHGPTLREIPSVKPSFVHRYDPLPDGTDALCQVRSESDRGSRSVDMVDCRVSAGFEDLGGNIIYQIEYVHEDVEVISTVFPFRFVERVLPPRHPDDIRLALRQQGHLRMPSRR